MDKLIRFLVKQRATIVFILLQVLNIWILASNDHRYYITFLKFSSQLSGKILNISGNASNYFQLKEINTRLQEENRLLKQQLLNSSPTVPTTDTVHNYIVKKAKVIGNSFRNAQNFLVLDVGKKEGIKPGMAVISNYGVVGQVRIVSQHFASVYSLLNPNMLISSKIKKKNTLCTTQWEQGIPTVAKLRYVPRHIKLNVGDTIVTSGSNSIFPENIKIGVIKEVQLEDHMTFYEATLTLATDFTSLVYVYVIEDQLKQEKDSVRVVSF